MAIVEHYHPTDELDLLAKALCRLLEVQPEAGRELMPAEFWQDVRALRKIRNVGWLTAIEIALRLWCKVHQLEVPYVEA